MDYIINVYVRPSEWFASIIQTNEYGADIRVSVNKESCNPAIYARGWEDYAEKWEKEDLTEVNIHHLDNDY